MTLQQTGRFAGAIRAALADLDRPAASYRAAGSAWTCVLDPAGPGSADGAGPRYLQNLAMGVDLHPDHADLFPLGSEGHIRVRFAGEVRTATGVVRTGRDAGVPRVVTVAPDRLTLRVSAEEGEATMTYRLDGEAVAASLRWRGAEVLGASLSVEVRAESARVERGCAVLVARTEPPRPFLAIHSNTRTPDPLAPAARDHLIVVGPRAGEGVSGDPVPAPGGVEHRRLTWGRDGGGPGELTVLVRLDGAVDPDPRAIGPVADAAPGAVSGGRLRLTMPSEDLTRQAGFAVVNSTLSQARDGAGRSISLHGRPGNGFGDVAHLHQSYQMHLVALLDGQTSRVREEILAFLALQDDEHRIARSPRPGPGHHPYVTGYSEAHAVLATHRYLAATGDHAFLDAPSPTRPGARVLDDLVVLVDRLLADTVAGLAVPCGWIDAWPEGVVAQGQASLALLVALGQAGELCDLADRPGEASRLRARRDVLAVRIAEVFRDPGSGVLGEHLLDDGRVLAGSGDDFWVHTQIWASRADLPGAGRAVAAAADVAGVAGVAMCAPRTLEAWYLATVVDPDHPADGDVIRVWTSSAWPELTNLLALELARHAQPDRALDLIRRALPEHLHALNRHALPWVYPEKVLEGDHLPWLSTWGGDPTLVEALVCGLAGVRLELHRLVVDPALPTEWIGQEFEIAFWWRGRDLLLRFDPTVPAGTVVVRGVVVPAPAVIAPDTGPVDVVRVGTGRTTPL